MNKNFYRFLTWFLLPAGCGALLVALYFSISEPLEFKEERMFRQREAVQRLKDIRELQEAFCGKFGRYAPTMDSLIWFYNTQAIKVVRKIGSYDDSLAVENTKKITQQIKNKKPGISDKALLDSLNARYEKNTELRIVFQTEVNEAVKDRLFKSRNPKFIVDSLRYIPYSGGDTVIMRTTLDKEKGYLRPLFEACMPFKSLLRGMDNQMRINLDAEQEDKGHYKGLKVGDAETPNGNAGNWEEEDL